MVELLIDNDVVIKLARMDAYDHGMGSLGINLKKVGSLATMLRYMARKPELTRSAAEADRLRAILSRLASIEPTPEESQLAAQMMKAILENELDTDQGEVTLMAVALERDIPRVATADKRALRDLPQLAAVFPRLKALLGRFICFEQIFKALCRKHGLLRVRDAVVCCPDADDAITQAYDYYKSASAKKFMQGMDAIIQDRISSKAPAWLVIL